MIKNYLKIAIRSFRRQKLISTINIIGLSTGIACASLGFVFVQHELSYDQFHEEPEQIYWLSASIQNKINIASTPAPLATQLKETFPEVSESFRLEKHEILIQSGNEFFRESGHFVDSNFFSFFDFELSEGNPDQVFSKTNAIVLNEEMARKYFGRLSPLGKELKVNYQGQDHLFEVTGVAKKAPQVSSLQFTFLLPIQFIYKDKPEDLETNWNQFPVTSFIRIRDKSDLESLQEKLPEFISDKVNIDGLAADQLNFQTKALVDYHLRDQYSANGLSDPADMSYVRILAIIAILILLVACLNFMNLANAKGSGRLSEIGVRRVLGAVRKQLMSQFLIESILMSLFSLGLGIIIIELALPFISEITGFPLEINWFSPVIIFPLLGIAILTGLFAGFYPSLLLSRISVTQSFKSNFKTGGNNLITKSSLVFQFALSIGLLSCTFIMQKQQQYIKKRNLGFNKEEVIVVPTQISYQNASNSQQFVNRFSEEVLTHPRVLQTSGVSNSFNKGNRAIFVEWGEERQIPVFTYDIDPNYIPLLGIQLEEGRNFSAELQAAKNNSIIVNEAFLKQFGINQIENYQLPEEFEELSGAKIIGVVKDYNYTALKSEIRPVILQMRENSHFGDVLIKVDPAEIDKTILALKSAWQGVSPSKPFEFSFLDEDIQRQYLVEERWNKAVTGATILAIFIACLGLFGLIALILMERTKEIGIRKILGASIPNITWLISRQFIILLSIASLIAIPAAWWTMQKWLENFAYRINITILIFLVALGITMTIAILTAGLQTAKAAMQNPVDALRNE